MAGKILFQRLRFDADLLFLVGLFLGNDGINGFRGQLSHSGELLHTDCLRQGRCSVFLFNQIPQFRLFLLSQIGQLYGGRKGDAAFVYQFQNRWDKVREADIALDLSLTFSGLF